MVGIATHEQDHETSDAVERHLHAPDVHYGLLGAKLHGTAIRFKRNDGGHVDQLRARARSNGLFLHA